MRGLRKLSNDWVMSCGHFQRPPHPHGRRAACLTSSWMQITGSSSPVIQHTFSRIFFTTVSRSSCLRTHDRRRLSRVAAESS